MSYRRKKKVVGNKKVRNAIPTKVDGIQFRSRIEAFTYSKLKEVGITDFKYEVERFNLLDAFEYPEDMYEVYTRTRDDIKRTEFGKANPTIRNMTYMPDFTCIDHATKTGWIIETKGFSTDAFALRYKIFKHYLVSNNYKVSLYKPNTQGNVLKCIEMIKEKYYDKAVD